MIKALLSFLLFLVVQYAAAQTDTTENNFQAYKDKHASGNRSSSFLKQYIRKLDSLNLPTDQQLLDEYVSSLQVRDLDNFETLSFLLQQGPLLQSKTYRLIYMNKTIVDSIYHKLPLNVRKKMNGKIIKNTLQKAVQEKDVSLAQSVSHFVYNSWQESNGFLAEMESERTMVDYLEQIVDTTQYFPRATRYYNRFYISLTPDSMFKMNLAAHNKKPFYTSLDSATKEKWNQIPEARKRYYDTLFAKSLHHAAASFVKLKANGARIYTALQWIQAAIGWRTDVPEYYHTFAEILASLDLYQEAIDKEQQAIKLSEKQKKNTADYQRNLKKLKQAVQ